MKGQFWLSLFVSLASVKPLTIKISGVCNYSMIITVCVCNQRVFL